MNTGSSCKAVCIDNSNHGNNISMKIVQYYLNLKCLNLIFVSFSLCVWFICLFNSAVT